MRVTGLLVCAALSAVSAYKYDGTVDINTHGFGWLGKFVYDYKDEYLNSSNPNQGYVPIGVLKLTLTNKDKAYMNDGNWSVTLFDDQSNSFHDIYPFGKHDMSCVERRTLQDDTDGTGHSRYNRRFTWDEDGKFTANIKIKEHVEPRFWWAYVTNCNRTVRDDGPSIKFETHYYQLNSNKWSEELGKNEYGLNTFYLVMFIVWFLLLTIQGLAYYRFRVGTNGNVHLVVKLLTMVMCSQFMSVMFHLINFATYANSGYPQLWAEVMANVFEICASSIFMLLLLVMGSGWTITDIDFDYKRHALVATVFLFSFKVSVWMWRAFALDPESTQYLYNTAPMYVYGSIMLAVGLIFTVLVFRSYRAELLSHKKQLYLILGCVYSLWFATPMLQIVIGDAVDAWARDLVVVILELCWDTLAFAVMMALLWPAWATKYFHLDRTHATKQIMAGNKPGIQQDDWDRL